jgi:hypothetical protein
VTSSSKQFYDPVTLSVMAAPSTAHTIFFALDSGTAITCELALHIIREADSGESDPRRLADSAILSVLNISTRRVP